MCQRLFPRATPEHVLIVAAAFRAALRGSLGFQSILVRDVQEHQAIFRHPMGQVVVAYFTTPDQDEPRLVFRLHPTLERGGPDLFYAARVRYTASDQEWSVADTYQFRSTFEDEDR